MKIDDVIAQVALGLPPNQLALKIPWKTYSIKEWDELRVKARQIEDPSLGLSTLRFLFQVSQSQDNWFSIRVLCDVCQFSSLPDDQRSNVLKTVKRCLDKLWKDIVESKIAIESLKIYFAYEAFYHFLSGETAERNGKPELAYEEYTLAVDGYKKSGDPTRLGHLEDRLQAIHWLGASEKPTDLETRRLSLQQEIGQLEERVRHENELLEQVSTNLHIRQTEVQAANQALSDTNAAIQENVHQRDHLQQMIQLLQKEHHDNLTELERLKSDVVKTKLEEFSPVTAVSETDYQKLKKQLEEAQAQIIQLEQKRLHSVERNLPGFINSSVTQKR